MQSNASRQHPFKFWLSAVLVAILCGIGIDRGHAISITATSAPSEVWMTNSYSEGHDVYSLDNSGGMFISNNTNLSITCDLDDRLNSNIPLAYLSFSQNSTLILDYTGLQHAGSIIGAATPFGGNPVTKFVDMGTFVNGAVAGTNNYLALEAIDTAGLAHYGWMEFYLGAFSNNAPALLYEGGYVNDVAGVPVAAGAVPEPSSELCLLGALGVVAGAIYRRSRAVC